MNKSAQYSSDSFNAYMFFMEGIALKARKKNALKNCKVCESMKIGYEMMAQINLECCESGLIDYLSALSIFESKLNGDDN